MAVVFPQVTGGASVISAISAGFLALTTLRAHGAGRGFSTALMALTSFDLQERLDSTALSMAL
jgi:hypothetical protein